MHTETDRTGALVAAAEALRAGRAAARRLVSPACDPLRREDFPDPDSLARRLSEGGTLSDAVARDVAALLARCDALIGQGTTERTEWMPKAVCGDDVTEWEPWTRPEYTPEAEALLPVAEDLRLCPARPAPRPCSEARLARRTESAASAETGSATCARRGSAAR